MASQVIGRVRPAKARAWESGAAYGPLDRVDISGVIYECVETAAAGEGPVDAPDKWMVVSPGFTKEEFDSVKAAAGAALPKAGGEMTGPVTNVSQGPNTTFAESTYGYAKILDYDGVPDGADHNAYRHFIDNTGRILGSTGIQAQANGDSLYRVAYLNKQPHMSAQYSNAALWLRYPADGEPYASCPTPRMDTYGSDMVNMSAMKNHAPAKIGSGVHIHVNQETGSDTADLFAGRGLSAGKPFKTLAAAIAFACANHAGAGHIVVQLHSDADIDDLYMRVPGGVLLTLRGEGAKRTINKSGVFELRDGALAIVGGIRIANTAAEQSHICANGVEGSPVIRINSVELSGAATNGAVMATLGGRIDIAQVSANYTGDATGPRYSATFGAQIIVHGKGPDFLPGTEAGVCDESSTYA